MHTIENIVGNLKNQVLKQDNLIKGTIKTITQDYLNKYRVSEQDDQGFSLPGHPNDKMLASEFERAAEYHSWT